MTDKEHKWLEKKCKRDAILLSFVDDELRIKLLQKELQRYVEKHTGKEINLIGEKCGDYGVLTDEESGISCKLKLRGPWIPHCGNESDLIEKWFYDNDRTLLKTALFKDRDFEKSVSKLVKAVKKQKGHENESLENTGCHVSFGCHCGMDR